MGNKPTWRSNPEEVRKISPEEGRTARRQFRQLVAEMEVLLGPWARYLELWQPTELVLSPHFLLNLLPLHAVTWKGKPLIEHFPIVYLPSPALAEDILNQSKPLTKEALLLGNPTGDLKQAEAEVREIAKQLKRKGFQSPDPPVTGSQATTHCVYTQAPSAAFIHFACHSFLEPTDFLRSGVELVDRRLTALDVSATLELKNAALVFLNSCDSGQALPGHTDELVALTRVFLYAGSPTILATLWALDDRVGRTFAEYFYKFWIDKEQPLAVAFQKAMRKTRVLYDHPFDWAPFVLMGAWQAGYFHEH